MEIEGNKHSIPGSLHHSFFHPLNLKPALCAVNKIKSIEGENKKWVILLNLITKDIHIAGLWSWRNLAVFRGLDCQAKFLENFILFCVFFNYLIQEIKSPKKNWWA